MPLKTQRITEAVGHKAIIVVKKDGLRPPPHSGREGKREAETKHLKDDRIKRVVQPLKVKRGIKLYVSVTQLIYQGKGKGHHPNGGGGGDQL